MSQPILLLNLPAPEPPAPPKRRSRNFNPKEFKVVALRECPTLGEMDKAETPEGVAAYWRANIPTDRYFNPDAECFIVVLVNTRRRILGHNLVSIGTLDTILVHPREVFRAAIIAAAAAIVLVHPSGEATPSEADIKVTRDLIRAGQLLKIEVLDHVIMGYPALPDRRDYSSLRELGYFCTGI
jgi:DNA repair protein RadC